MQSGVDTCCCRTISEETLQELTVRAINNMFSEQSALPDKVMDCTRGALSQVAAENEQEIRRQIQELQFELTKYQVSDPMVEEIGNKILNFKKQLDDLGIQTAMNEQRLASIRELAEFFGGMTGPLTEYDENYVRRLFSRITVFDDKVVFLFKDGQEVTINE